MLDWKAYVRQNLQLENVRPEREVETVDELAQQLEDAYRDALSRGLNEAEAHAFACSHIRDWEAISRTLRESGNSSMTVLEQLECTVANARAHTGLASRFARLPQDLLFAMRMMRKNPAFTLVAVLTLALGIGANTAIFSVLNAMLLRRIPVRQPEQLVSLRWSAQTHPKLISHSSYGDCQTYWASTLASSCSFSLPFFRALQQSTSSPVAGWAGFGQAPRLDLSWSGQSNIVQGRLVSGDFFSTLGIHSAAGRLIGPGDDDLKAANVVVFSYRYWQSALAGDISIIGKTVHLNSVPFVVVGVADPRFTTLAVTTPEDLWLPLSANPQLIPNYDPRQADSDSFWVEIVARLRGDVSREKVEAEVATLFRNAMIHGDRPMSKEADRPSVHFVSLSRALGPAPEKLQPVYVLTLAVGIILLIACANVAGLLLARAMVRRKEIAVRLAIGASRNHILGQLLTESVLLSGLGGVCGVLFAIVLLRAITNMLSDGGQHPLPFTPTIDLRVLGFTAAVSVITGILFGLAPGLRAASTDLNLAMNEAAGTRERRSWFSFGNGLVFVQVELAIVLLIGAGMMVRTLTNLERVNPGFDTRNILIFGIDPRLANYKPEQVDALYGDLQQRLAAVAGVEQVSYSSRPLLRGSLRTHDVHFPGTPVDSHVEVDYMPVGPNFFVTLGIPILAGQDFTESEFNSARKIALQVLERPHDTPPTEPMPVIVNRTFAKQYLKGDVLGRQFGYENEAERKSFGYEVVGVVSDAKYNDLRRDIKPTMYVPSAGAAVFFELRTALDPNSLISAVRSTVSSVDGALPLFDIKTQKQQIEDMLVSERTLARLSGFFGLVALLLASIGLYGLLAYDVTRRTREVGIRMALGARRSDVIGIILQRGLSLATAGALAGTSLGFVLVRLAKSLLFGVGVFDPMTFASVLGLLFLVALAACLIPARQAASVDPMISLRCE